VLLVADRKPIGQESDVDVSVANKERLHRTPIGMISAIRLLTTRPRSGKLSTVICIIWGLTAPFTIIRHFLSRARDTREPR
jgi:hypothetical protein